MCSLAIWACVAQLFATLIKSFVDIEKPFRDYRKFRSESKITVVGETQ